MSPFSVQPSAKLWCSPAEFLSRVFGHKHTSKLIYALVEFSFHDCNTEIFIPWLAITFSSKKVT